MMRLGVLISGSGSNLQAILDAIASGKLRAEIAEVISNVEGAGGLARAQASGVATRVIDHRGFGSREQFDQELVASLNRARVDYVVLAGFMRLLTPVLLNAFSMRVINVHPALLPAFPGMHGQAQALAYGVCIAGCTVHFVDAGTDTGPIIAQAAVPVHDGDDEESLRKRILKAEHALLPEVLGWLADGLVDVECPKAGSRARVRVRGRSGAMGLKD